MSARALTAADRLERIEARLDKVFEAVGVLLENSITDGEVLRELLEAQPHRARRTTERPRRHLRVVGIGDDQ